MLVSRIVVPLEGYLHGVADLCKKHNVLLICDEIQTVWSSPSLHGIRADYLPFSPLGLLD